MDKDFPTQNKPIMCRHHFAEDCDCVDGYRKQPTQANVPDKDQCKERFPDGAETGICTLKKGHKPKWKHDNTVYQEPTQLPKRPVPERWKLAYEEATEMSEPRYWQGQHVGATERNGLAARVIEELGAAEYQLKTVLDRESATTARYDAKIAELESRPRWECFHCEFSTSDAAEAQSHFEAEQERVEALEKELRVIRRSLEIALDEGIELDWYIEAARKEQE